MDAPRAVDPAKVERLTAQLYDELRGLARSVLRGERKDHSLQPTALVNEAYLRLIDQATPALQSRTHFLGIAAVVMRQVLVDHARQRNAQKRLGGRVRVTLGDDLVAGDGPLDALVMDEALTRLAAIDERRAKVVTLRVFGGLTEEEVADLLDLSRTTVATDWRAARAWLSRELRRHAGEG
jgi:RNA polymerase sigma-70 factor (ECF subfamily)